MERRAVLAMKFPLILSMSRPGRNALAVDALMQFLLIRHIINVWDTYAAVR